MIYFTIPGPAKGKGRPKFSRRGNFVSTYTPKDTVDYENWVKLCYQSSGDSSLDGEIHAEIHCYFEIPKSYSKKKRELALKGEIRPTTKPDLDNIAKCILDSLNGMAYKDDSQIVSLLIEKHYAEVPIVTVKMEETK